VFSIRLTSEVPDELEDGVAAVYGNIQIGDFHETFIASLCEWSDERYASQWQEAAHRLVNGESKSAFVTSFVPPDKSLYFVWWPCYRIGETVYVQNQMRFYEQLPSPFLVNALYDYVADRKVVSEDDGTAISEWELPLEWLRDFVRRGVGS
jgi:CdiI N-terminal domain